MNRFQVDEKTGSLCDVRGLEGDETFEFKRVLGQGKFVYDEKDVRESFYFIVNALMDKYGGKVKFIFSSAYPHGPSCQMQNVTMAIGALSESIDMWIAKSTRAPILILDFDCRHNEILFVMH